MASGQNPDLSFSTNPNTIRLRTEKAPGTMSTQKSLIPRLSILIPTLLAVWLATVVALHGPAMIAYVVLHIVTTGVFAFGMWKVEKKHGSTVATGGPSPMLKKTSNDVPAQEADVAIAS